MEATITKQALETLCEEFQGKKMVHTIKLQASRRDFKNIKMKNNETNKTIILK